VSSPRSDIVIPELLQGQWTAALICTFGADLTFFETRLLGQLAQVPLRILLADHAQLANTLAESARTGQRHRLANKAYVAAPVRHARAAHGKLILLLAPTSGLMVVGSGNLGYEGYAAPGELWHVYAYSDERQRHVGEFAAARSHLDGLVTRGLLDPPVSELLQTAWDHAPWVPLNTTSPTAVRSNLDSPLIEQLREVVAEPVDELVAHAPFHDADCAALQALIDAFTPKRIRLLITDATSADPESIQRVIARVTNSVVERVHVKTEPAAYIHAKWVHLIHGSSESLLSGSANLSRSALLRSADSGNVEIGVVTTGQRGSFDGLYDHLDRSQVDDVSSLGISYQGAAPGEQVASTYPVVLWSRIDGAALTLVFDRSLPPGTKVEIEDHGGATLVWDSEAVDGAEARFGLTQESGGRLLEGGRIQVRLDGDDDQVSFSWPYHLAHLRGRLDRAGQRERLPRMGDLPEQDAELYELLQELDASLIIDRSSVWRIAKPNDPVPKGGSQDDEPLIRLEDLDWGRVRRDPRYSGYFGPARGPGLAPTDIQVILAAIAGRLAEIGMSDALDEPTDDDELAREGDTTSSDAEDLEDELEDELARRRLPVSTRTRMAFDRFVRRYAAALKDSAFIEELGPIPAVTNATIFNHLLVRLLERNAVSTPLALSAQLVTWAFLWGTGPGTGILATLDDEVAEVIRHVLADGHAKVTTVRGVAAHADSPSGDGDAADLREFSRHLLLDDDFGLDADLLVETAGSATMARGLLDSLSHAAAPTTPAEILDVVAAPHDIARVAVHWRHETVRRRRGKFGATTFVVTSMVNGLTPELAVEMLGRVAVAACYAGHPGSYWRIRFEGNGLSVAFWDDDSQSGVVLVDGDDQDFDAIDPPWPAWALKSDELESALIRRQHVVDTA